MKLLFVVILKTDEYKFEVLKELNKSEKKGTVIPTTSVKHALLQNDIEPLPQFGGWRQLRENEHDLNTTILLVIDESELAETKAIIKRVTASCKDGAGIMFAVPVTDFEEHIV